jgi:hypothetical protein
MHKPPPCRTQQAPPAPCCSPSTCTSAGAISNGILQPSSKRGHRGPEYPPGTHARQQPRPLALGGGGRPVIRCPLDLPATRGCSAHPTCLSCAPAGFSGWSFVVCHVAARGSLSAPIFRVGLTPSPVPRPSPCPPTAAPQSDSAPQRLPEGARGKSELPPPPPLVRSVTLHEGVRVGHLGWPFPEDQGRPVLFKQ